MAGYWNRPEETANVMTADGFFRTGDIGVMDERGYTKIVDRKKDMILVSGFNVYPNEIEEVIASHPGVLECAVIGVADAKSGEAVKVFIVKKDPNLTADDVIKFCGTQLTGYKVPKQIEFRTDLPKTNVGKILRRELRDEKEGRGLSRIRRERPIMTDARDVAPADILAFWREAGRDRWYKRDDAFDAEVRRRFLELWRKAAAGELSSWKRATTARWR